MNEINRLSKKERVDLSTGVEGFFPISKTNSMFNRQYEHFLSYVDERCTKEVWLLITSITRAIRYGNTKTFMSFDNNYYSGMVKSHNTKPISTTRLNVLLTTLEHNDYLKKYKGFKFEDDGSQSIIVFHEKLLDMFEEEICEKFGAAREYGVIEVYETTRDYKGVKNKRIVSSKGQKGILTIRKDLVNYNKLLSKSIIKVEGLIRNDVVYKRVFEGGLYLAGRYYTMGSFLSTTKLQRETITINGKNTCSLDYSKIHPSIIRTLLGLPRVDNDVYSIDIDAQCDPIELRNLCKVGLMCLLFNDSQQSAIRALNYKLTKDKNPLKSVGRNKITKEDCDYKYKSLHNENKLADKVIKGLLNTNKDLEPMLFNEKLWAALQGYDSKMATFIINYFTRKGVCVLCWHDGFVIDTDHKDELAKVMEEAWVSVLGNNEHFGYSVEFDNTPKFSFKCS